MANANYRIPKELKVLWLSLLKRESIIEIIEDEEPQTMNCKIYRMLTTLLHEEWADLEARNHLLNNSIANLRNAETNLKDEVEEAKKKLDKFKTMVDELQSQVEIAGNGQSALQEANDKLKETIASLERKLAGKVIFLTYTINCTILKFEYLNGN